MHVFREVAQEQSLSRAARTLHISQPAVTQHIKALEEFFKTTLFVRSSSGVTLTPAGLVLHDHARRIGEMHEEVTRKLTESGGAIEGRVRLGVSKTITEYYLPHVLLAIKARHPAVEIDVLEENTDAVISSLLARRIELGLIEAPCRRRDLRALPFFEDEIIVIAPPRHPLVKRPAVTIAELIREPVVLREIGSGTRMVMEAALRKRKITLAKLSVVMTLPSSGAIKRVVQGGVGISFVSRISVEDELKAGTLVEIKVRGLDMRRPFSAILPLGPDPVGLRQLILNFLPQGRRAA